MKRATLIYLVTLVLCAAGVVAILKAGSNLRAPPDMAGRWVLSPLASEPPGDAPGRVRTLDLEQSGQYVRLSLDRGPHVPFKLASAEAPAEAGAIALRNGTTRLVMTPLESRSRWRIEITGADAAPAGPATYTGRRAGPPERAGATALPAAPQSGPAEGRLLLVIGQLIVIISMSLALGALASRIRQPRVMGEMVAGLVLGPSVLGLLVPDVSAALFPAHSIPTLGLLAQVGVMFFLFLIGLELDPRLLSRRGEAAVVISHVSIVAPFLLGAALALFLYQRLFNDTAHMRFTSVALFMGAAMSITAFPVLARILTERNLHRTHVGAITITCAAVDDVTAWCLLAFVVGLARAEGVGPALLTTVLSAAYVLGMFFLVRPFLARIQVLYDRQGRLSSGVLAIVLLVALASACATEAIGIHALFGAFLAGAVMPSGTRFVREVSEKMQDFTLIILVPIFFAYTGLRTRIELIGSPELWGVTLLIIAVACAGKFGGSTLAAAACGHNWREASAIGILMNTRGLMELVILNIGRELGVISDAVFAMMVIMALVTTFLTTPVLSWVYPERVARAVRRRVAPAPGHFSVLIPVSLPRSARPLVQLADMISGTDNERRSIIGLYLERAVEHEAYEAAAASGGPERPGEPLAALIEHGGAIGVTIEPMSFVSRDAADDIARVAQEHAVSLILMGFHKPILGNTILGGTVHRVLQQAPTDVAIFVDRGLPDRPASILVPYLGSVHDRLALEIAARMGRHSGAAITVLHVVPPARSVRDEDRPRLHARAATEQTFTDPTQPSPVSFQVVEHADPISAVLEHARPFDLVVVGVAEEWGLRSQLFGWRAERIARDCATSLLIVRRHTGSGGPPGP